jgi:hypothetical protein
MRFNRKTFSEKALDSNKEDNSYEYYEDEFDDYDYEPKPNYIYLLIPAISAILPIFLVLFYSYWPKTEVSKQIRIDNYNVNKTSDPGTGYKVGDTLIVCPTK